MKIVVAPDSFKGSMTALQACQAMTGGARRVFPAAEIVELPLADGGEGTLDVVLDAGAGRIFSKVVRGALGENQAARWGILPDGRAVIEMAQVCGLTLSPPDQRDALRASTYGVGQLTKAALDAGCREIILAIGGSATTDGGLGALSALGLRARDKRERALAPGGGALTSLQTLDARFLDARLQRARFTVLCDVANPLHGPHGAAHSYGPQKGATPADVEILDRGLEKFADVVARKTGHDKRQTPGAGAAGGIAFGFMAYCNAQLRSGIEIVLEIQNFDAQSQNAELILTGEGAIDAQTLNGKTVAGVCRIARANQVPVIAFGGAVKLSGAQMDELGLLSACVLADGARTLPFCINNGATLLSDAVERGLRVWRGRTLAKEEAER